VTIPYGQTQTTFAVTTQGVASTTTATITANYSGSSASAVLTVTPFTGPYQIASLTLSPPSVAGGSPSTGTITLNGPAPTAGLIVALTSSVTTTATVPATVTVPALKKSVTFTVTTYTVASVSSTTISATYSSSTKSATLTVGLYALPDVSSISLNPSSVTGGSPSTGTVTLTGPTLLGGQFVSLASDSSVASVPARVFVPNGQSSATFTVLTSPVAQLFTATISAVYASGTPKSTTLTINPYTGAPGSRGLALTAAGISEGFALTTFATNFPTTADGLIGPFGLAYTSSQHLYAIDFYNHYLYDFPTDVDGQSTTFVSHYPTGSGCGLTNDRGVIYMTTGTSVVSVDITNGVMTLATIVTNLNNAFGIAADPANGHLFVTSQGNKCIYDIDPVAKTATVFLSGLTQPDGVWVSPSGGTVYFTSNSHVYGYTTAVHSLVFDSGKMTGPDGVVLGTGSLYGKLYVNTNAGEVWEFDLTTGGATLIASGGSRGDFATTSPGSSMLVTQSDRIMRLTPSTPGSFETAGKIIVTRDDLTNPNTVNYSPFSLTAPQVYASASPYAIFDAFGLGGTVTQGYMQRGGQLTWSNATHFDAMLGISSIVQNGPNDVGNSVSGVQAQASPWLYTMYWALGQPFCADISAGLGRNYQLALTDQISAAAGNYTITDTPHYNWPDLWARNILMFLLAPANNPAIAQGRALDLALSGSDVPLNALQWDILGPDDTIIASSVSPNGWDVEPDHNDFHGIWVTVPGVGTVTTNYTARVQAGGSASFDVVQAVTPQTTAAVLLPISLQNTVVVGGNNTTCTLTLDAPAPNGGAVITLVCHTSGVTVPLSATIPVGQTSVSFTINTQTTTTLSGADILASFNGIRETGFTVVPAGSVGPAAPLNLTATGAPGQVTLNWTAPAPKLAYNLKRSLVNGGPYTTIAHGLVTTQYIDTNVANNTTYYYVVTAYNVYGESVNSNQASATPTVTVPVAGLSVNPISVVGGYLSIGTVRLATAAPNGGVPVTLSSTVTGAATVPTTITVPSGAVSADFLVTTFPVAADTLVSLSATASGTTSTATLTVLAPSVTAVTILPNPVTGGVATLGTAALNGDAATGGATVALASANTSVASLPVSTVTIPAGNRSATFTINTTTVSSSMSVAITATHSTACKGSATSNVIVNPTNLSCYLANISLSPTCIIGAGTSTATVTLSAAAPTGGALVLLHSNSVYVTIPASVTVPAGSLTATFSVSDYGVPWDNTAMLLTWSSQENITLGVRRLF